MMFTVQPIDFAIATARANKRRTRKIRWTAQFGTGEKSQQGRMIGGVREGLWTFWHRNGQVATYGHYQHGRKQGHWIHWRPDGRPEAKFAYKNGRLEVLGLNPTLA